MRKIILNGATASIILLVLLFIVGAGIRLYRLGDMDTRGDEVTLLVPPMATFTPIENFLFDWHGFKTGRTMCLPRMTASTVMQGLRLPTNRFNLRITYCLMGILTIPALFLLGIKLGDRRLAWLLAFFGAINPYYIFYSRMAHVYAFPILFNVLAAAFAAAVIRSILARQLPRKIDLVFFTAASILGCHSHVSSWPLVGLLWLLAFLAIAWERKHIDWRMTLTRCAVACGVWFLVLSPWVYLFISAIFTARDSFPDPEYNPFCTFQAMWRVPFIMTWGAGLPRVILTVGLLVSGVWFGLRSGRWRYVMAATIFVGLSLGVGMSMMMHIANDFFEIRYYMPLSLIFLFVSTLGGLLLADWVAGWLPPRFSNIPVFAVAAVVFGYTAAPVYWVITLPGNPIPYSIANRWMDAHLPKGAPVVVDRWLQPWNEMLHNAPTNAIATFTVPNEPLSVMIKYNWTQTVKDFMYKYPDGAYLDLYSRSPYGMEPWLWPRQYLRRNIAFTNEEALKLGRVSLGPDEGYYTAQQWDTNGLIINLYYNTREDVLAIAAEKKQPWQLFYGPGWGYVKLWQELRDFRDWRVLEDQAVFDIYNLTAQNLVVNVTISAMAVNGSKRVVGPDGAGHDFRHLQLEKWPVGRWTLAPGSNSFVLKDPFWRMGHIRLLIDQVDVAGQQPATPNDGQAISGPPVEQADVMPSSQTNGASLRHGS